MDDFQQDLAELSTTKGNYDCPHCHEYETTEHMLTFTAPKIRHNHQEVGMTFFTSQPSPLNIHLMHNPMNLFSEHYTLGTTPGEKSKFEQLSNSNDKLVEY